MFRTVGFGGAWRAFPYVFQLTNSKFKSFSVASISKILSEIKDFNFDSWIQYGTGTAAETQAGDDLVAALTEAYSGDESGAIALKLD